MDERTRAHNIPLLICMASRVSIRAYAHPMDGIVCGIHDSCSTTRMDANSDFSVRKTPLITIPGLFTTPSTHTRHQPHINFCVSLSYLRLLCLYSCRAQCLTVSAHIVCCYEFNILISDCSSRFIYMQ